MSLCIKAKFEGKDVMVIETVLNPHAAGFICCVLDPEKKKLRYAFADLLEEVEVVSIIEGVSDPITP